MFKILVSDPISDFGLQKMTRAVDVEVAKITGLSEEELISIIRPYDALLRRSFRCYLKMNRQHQITHS
ncbi:phosphoglycerate dehydrogenase-like enzyme [Paenibacillus brasilensis]|uniref:Phosphoglycerate dehydrogenase-like enzyme n=1 Tax=Paenibacillus brasilensis TaxID=128574 RepID=A0ABU0L5F7_9BACL|nr:phosphoglycerate dehydrogenase-like enzyme [Paenibacillus brasilensis]